MLNQEAKKKLTSIMQKCRKAMFYSIDGNDALYAASIGNTCKDVYLNLDKYTDKEIHSIILNLMNYESDINNMLIRLGA